MTTPRAARLSALLAGAALTVVSVGVVAAPASAEPVYDEGGCTVSRMADAGPGGAQCAGMDLSGTRFGEGDFRNADLQNSSFVDGDVQGANFNGANLTGADFTGTRIVGADFTNSSILPGLLELEADASGMAPVPITPNLPTGLTLDGCQIVATPVGSGEMFPIGTSNILCTLSTSFEGTATAVMTVEVTASATAPPTEEPLFTPDPSAQQPQTTTSSTPNWLMIGGFIGGGVLVAGGIAAFVISNRRERA
ncbi:pentapeptide repeat-containing protein [Herbiconiux liukaitaii]|uniref:pentapeptide repeat-containing protein n=1 Tax=Herbiconiux liukaitaii TaxID=3342799 RepID=UPI0035B9E301